MQTVKSEKSELAILWEMYGTADKLLHKKDAQAVGVTNHETDTGSEKRESFTSMQKGSKAVLEATSLHMYRRPTRSCRFQHQTCETEVTHLRSGHDSWEQRDVSFLGYLTSHQLSILDKKGHFCALNREGDCCIYIMNSYRATLHTIRISRKSSVRTVSAPGETRSDSLQTISCMRYLLGTKVLQHRLRVYDLPCSEAVL
jgi:hypothetical protein